ncbi:MAG: hypothetical protein WBO55_04745 [Rhizobiaceae bacterium]
MRVFLALTLAASLGAAFHAHRIDTAPSAQTPESGRAWHVSGTSDCLLVVNDFNSPSSGVHFSGNCSQAPGKIAQADFWRVDQNGLLSLSDENGNVITRFGPDDLEGWVSVEPSSFLVSLSPQG